MIGDPAGVGPEVVARSWASGELHQVCRPILIGSGAVMHQAMRDCGLSLAINIVNSLTEQSDDEGVLDILEPTEFDSGSYTPAQDNLSCGAISAQWLDEADRMARTGECVATVMAPISSVSMKMAGVLDKVVNVEPGQSYLFLISGPLRVMHLTDHMPLRQVCDVITSELVTSALKMLDTALKSWGIEKPRIVVAGLNPHASGVEEDQEIAPGVARAQSIGIDATGPEPPDSVFRQCIEGRYDVVLAMTHDQGHIAIKTWGFAGNCALVLGLPYVHTTVAHGTAYDLVGTGRADHTMVLTAIKTAASLVAGKGFLE
ncbi:4-hydroxythreonine-4-phosphate dehydrogenase [Halieaceae bacterium IMCC8485]|uniref:4-hydroxythreonine-4-phosphate dehydrogenase n=2 Tax=Candidatus Seongchinamella marina TaxID=2518990 RepID=A0ABT3SZY8_9GAMM|nr:4-hydroxythreonine-4-phosphate dehydrogenase [Candidatus Seongchinamella marina]